MRRPAPLPADEANEPERVAPARRGVRMPRRTVDPPAVDRPETTAGTDGAATDADADATAPIVPLTAPSSEAPAGAAADAEAAAGPDEELTGRDLWRAARARRRALRSEIRRFTQRSRRRRLVWLSAFGAVLLVVGGSALAAYSPLFAVERITVVGASALNAAEVEAALASQQGRPLALVDDSEVKAALIAFPLIETYALEAKPPHDLVVRIVERTPVGVIDSDAGFSLVDAAGVVLSTTPERPEGRPVLEIDGGTDSVAFEAAGTVVRSLSQELRDRLTEVRASTGDDVALILDDGTTVIWGSADDSSQKALNLSSIMKAVPDARSYDVSSTEAVAVR